MDIVQIKCPNCGAPLMFDPAAQKHACEYCLSEFTKEDIEKSNELADNAEDNYNVPTQEMQDEFNAHTNLYICDSCGAEIISDENTAATFCCYCHNPVTLKGRVTGECRPELIIPFKFTRDQALEKYLSWCKKKWFLPNDFTSANQLEKVTGLYVPYWLADCTVNASVSAEAHIVHTRRQGDYRITHTKVYDVQRAATMEYLGVPADASKKLEDELMDSVEPFDYKEFQPFSMTYLSGFYADKFDVEKAEVLPRIKNRITQGAQDVLMKDIKGYTSVTPRTRNTNVIRTNWHYTMLPVWFMTYKYNDKSYFFGMNGQTGKMVGKLPVSIPKLIGFSAGVFAVVGLISGFIGGAML
ncbi:MAG: hypothetical protein IJ007_01160 [Oscillospiraceae bacterium]|nr:hypothetical protein [Oscillospiraceae bacterium]